MAAAITTGSLAHALGARLDGPAALPLAGIDALDRAGPGTLTFIRTPAFAALWPRSRAAAAIVARGVEVPGHDASARALLFVDSVDLALVKALALFAPAPEAPRPGVHPSAVVDPSAQVHPSASIGPGCIIGPGAAVGAGAALLGNVFVGRAARIGDGTVLHHGVYVGERCTVGRRCTLWPGVVVGADGFGYTPAPGGRGILKFPHVGTVEIGDEVEIGANSCIDRAKFSATVVGDGTKIDNLCQVGHNVRIGRACLVCGNCGLAGSVILGDGVILAAEVAVSHDVTIGSGARVGGRSAVVDDIPPGETWLGQPAIPALQAARNYAALKTIAEDLRALKKLQRALERRGLLDAETPEAAARE